MVGLSLRVLGITVSWNCDHIYNWIVYTQTIATSMHSYMSPRSGTYQELQFHGTFIQ